MQGVKNSSLVKRHLVAAVILPVFIAYVYYLPPSPYFLALLAVVAVSAMWEFFVMYKAPAKLYVPGLVLGAVLFYIFCEQPAYSLNAVLISLFFLLLLRLFFVSTPSGCMSDIGPLGIGILYIAGFLSFQWMIRKEALGLEYIFLLYFSVWLADSLALYIGTYLGRHKLYPAISPNKTVEGAFGSVLGGVLGASIAKAVFGIQVLSTAGVILTGSALGTAALIGDLIESMLKRDAGVKDSSRLIPGHGGVLDKLDGMLIAGPVLYLIVRWF